MFSFRLVIMVLLFSSAFSLSAKIPQMNIFDYMPKKTFEALLTETNRRIEILERRALGEGELAMKLRYQALRLQNYLEKERKEPAL